MPTQPHAPARPAALPWSGRRALLVLLTLALGGSLLRLPIAAAQTGGAPNPFDLEQQELASQSERGGRRPEGALPLLELWDNWDWATPATSRALLERLYESRRLSPARRGFTGAILARARLRTGDMEGSEALIQDLGYITDWRVIGSFDNEGKRGFEEIYGPETERLEPWTGSEYPGRERPVSWRPYPSETNRLGYINFDALFRPYANVCGYAETFVTMDAAQPVSLWVGGGGATKVWWNGEEVLADETYRQPFPDRHAVTVAGRGGANRVLVKSCIAESAWGFFFRVADARGAPLDVETQATRYFELGEEEAVRLPRSAVSILAQLERAAERGGASALENLARFLSWTLADDPAENAARELAARAAAEQPTVDRYALAMRLAEQRADRMRFAAAAVSEFPDSREARFLQAVVRSTGPSPVNALMEVRALKRVADTVGLRAAHLESRLLEQLEMTEAAYRAVEASFDAAGRGAPGWLLVRARAAGAAGHADTALERRRELLEARYDHVESRRALCLDALRRRDLDEVRQQLTVLEQLLPDSTRNMMFAATVLEGLGEVEEAMTVLHRAHTLSPEAAEVWAALGRLQLRAEQPDAATVSLRRALAYAPQDAPTRELLEQVEPDRERADERYAADQETLLARRVENAGFPATILQNLTVNTVFPNGLGSSFHQWAAQAHDDEGARQIRTYSIQFDPNTQRVDVRKARVFREDGRVLEATQTFERQLGEPWYRIYYDTRALVVVFPDLEAGDTVEIQYRIDDVSHRNLFADYYGDLHFLQSTAPTRHLEYVLMTPPDRRFFINDPGLPDLTMEETVDDETRIRRFVRTDVAAIRSEPGMPGMTEVAPYLHVSTYQTWEQVGRWWWGLIEDQLQADESLRQTVRALVDDAPDLETKVARIQNWVVRNTRYVGLEFGIHGYKPYRVPQIVRRGFGDCKDKASLLYVMFREAGIDARIVLVRTRRNGRIDDLPASLAVFDHAIAYVPELDLYIDGTAEHNGSTELPPMDQGVTVLVVGPEDARLTRTPVLPPNRNRRERQLAVEVEETGDAVIEVDETVIGTGASSYRRTYAAEGTREERFERSLRRLFPGLVLENYSMENLGDLEGDVDLEYRARVPSLANADAGDGRRELRVAPTVLDDLVTSFARTPSRIYPLELGARSSYREERTVRSPPRYSLGSAPPGGVADSEFGRLEVSVDVQEREVRTQTDFELRVDRVDPADYGRFRAWVEEADGILRQRIRFEEDDR